MKYDKYCSMSEQQKKKYQQVATENLFFVSKLNELGINNKYTGYYYLIKIYEIIINGEKEVKSYSREIFPIVAKQYNKKANTVERNIRVLINNCWNINMGKKLKSFYTAGVKPTCCQFIYLIKNYILSFLI